MEKDDRNVILPDRYVKLGIFKGNLSKDEIQLREAMLLQQRVQENCLVKATVICLGSGFLGALVGTFLFAVNVGDTVALAPAEQPTGIKTELVTQYRKFFPYIMGSAKNFAKLGFMYSIFDCIIQKKRAKSDIYNSMYAGCITGAVSASKGGLLAATGGCAGFAAFSVLIEKYQRSGYR